MKPILSSLSDNEINSGKIWTLLRYNKAFQKDVKWFAAKYKTATNKRAKQETRENAKGEFHTKYQEIENINPFAATALQWMFPMPVFVNWNEDNQNQSTGWGPYVQHKQEGDKIDAFAEWKEYEAAKDFLSLETDWFSVNAGFKRDFMFQYRQFDSRSLNPITKNRSDSPFPHETDFFDDLDLVKLINQGPNVNESGLGKILHAHELKKNYRLLAVPRHLKTKKAVDDAFKFLIKEAKAYVPTKASVSLGTTAEWQDYMAVKGIQEEQNIPSKTKAIHILIKQRHSKQTAFKMRDARRTYEKGITENFNSIDSKIEAIYPVLLI